MNDNGRPDEGRPLLFASRFDLRGSIPGRADRTRHALKGIVRVIVVTVAQRLGCMLGASLVRSALYDVHGPRRRGHGRHKGLQTPPVAQLLRQRAPSGQEVEGIGPERADATALRSTATDGPGSNPPRRRTSVFANELQRQGIACTHPMLRLQRSVSRRSHHEHADRSAGTGGRQTDDE